MGYTASCTTLLLMEFIGAPISLGVLVLDLEADIVVWVRMDACVNGFGSWVGYGGVG